MSQAEQPAPYTPKESANTLISRSLIRIQDLICEGPISGFAIQSGTYGNDPLTSIYFDEIPARNLDGTYNFNASGQGFTLDYRLGTTDQTPITGFNKIENTINLSSNTRLALPPSNEGPPKHVVTSFNTDTYPDADSIKVTIRVPALYSIGTKGDVYGYEITWAVDISVNNGPFITQESFRLYGKCTSPYYNTVFFPLPKSDPPSNRYEWKVRVRRLSQNIMSSTTPNEIFVDSICVITNNSFSYPSTALVGLQLTAEQFASVPYRAYDIMGKLISIPLGYQPTVFHPDGTITQAVYPEIWTGEFDSNKKWSNNPAWIFYDLVTNKRYGLGNYVKSDWVDKWTLYEIAQYCDELVDDGNGGLEPRFTCNVVLQQRTEAYNLLLNLVSIFRGMLYWANGRMFSTFADNKSPIYNFTNANVVNGQFTYSDTAKNTRSTVIKVRWTNPQNLYREGLEYIEDTEGILKYGYIEKDVTAFGCTSKGQAIRIGSWILQTEKLLTETVTFQVGLDGLYVRPGDTFNIYDNFRNNKQQGGRIKEFNSTIITLDREVELNSGYNYALSIVNPKYNLEATGDITGSNQISEIRNSQIEDREVIVSLGGTTDTLFVNGPYSNIQKNAIWLLYVSGTSPSIFTEKKLYRCLAVSEAQDGNMEILGLISRTGINYSIETGYSVRTVPTNPVSWESIEPPSGLQVNLITGLQNNNSFYSYFRVSWTGTNSTNLAYYRASGKAFGGSWETITPSSKSTYINYNITNTGLYNFNVAAVSVGGRISTLISGSGLASGQNPLGGPPRLSGIYISQNFDPLLTDNSGYYTGYLGVEPEFSWRIPTGENGLMDPREQFLSGYKFHILNPSNSSPLTSSPVELNWDVKKYKLNRSIFENFVGGVRRDIKIYVETTDIYGNTTSGASLIVNNKIPETNIPTRFLADQDNIMYSVSPSAKDTDISGIYLWYNTGSITPTFDNYNEVGTNLAGTINNALTGNYSVWWSLVDTFGRSGCSIVGPVPIIQTNAYLNQATVDALNSFSGAFESSLTGSNTYISGLQSQINVLTTGLQSEINTRITGVNYTITGLQWEISNRISSFNDLLSGQSGNYNLITGEVYSRQTGDSAEITARQLQISSLSGYTTGAIYTTNTTFSNATGALASQIITLYAATGTLSSAINNESLARVSGQESLAQTTSSILAQLNTTDGDVQNLNDVTAGIQVVQTALVSATGSLASQVTTLFAASGALQSFINQEITARQTGDAAETTIRSTQISSLSGYVLGASGYLEGTKASIAYVDNVTTTLVNASGALVSNINTQIAQTNLNIQNTGSTTYSLIQAEITNRTNADSSEATQRNLVAAGLTGYVNTVSGAATTVATALVGSESSARATAISAEATMRNAVAAGITGYIATVSGATITNAQASITNLSNTLVSTSGVLATQTSNVQSSLNGTQATVQVLSDAFITGSPAKAVARWGFTVSAGAGSNKAIAGIEAVAANGESPVSAIRFLANVLQVCSTVDGTTYYPFQIVSGVTYINEAMIKAASITQAHIQEAAIGTAQIQNASITNAKIVGTIQSDNYVSGLSGWNLSKTNGDTEIWGAKFIKGTTTVGGREPSTKPSAIILDYGTNSSTANGALVSMYSTGGNISVQRGLIEWFVNSPGPQQSNWLLGDSINSPYAGITLLGQNNDGFTSTSDPDGELYLNAYKTLTSRDHYIGNNLRVNNSLIVNGNITTSGAYYVDGVQVVTNQQSSISDTNDVNGEYQHTTTINEILTALRNHGLIAL